MHPLGAPTAGPLTAPDADALDRSVHGLDAFVIPYGPVRSGVFEAIQFQIETGGETWRDCRRGRSSSTAAWRSGSPGCARPCGVRRRAGRRDRHRRLRLRVRQAVERAAGVQPPPAAERWRAVYAELERLACHFDVIAKEAETTALYVGQARFQILKEQVMRLRAQLTGSRFARGVIVPGGVRYAGALRLDGCRRAGRPRAQLIRDRRLFLGTASMTDRLIGAGRLPRALVEDYGAVGPLARGSGVSTDARHERPYGDYRRLGLQVVTHREGDAMARVNVRFGEVFESLRILRQAIDHLRRGDGELQTPLPPDAEGARSAGWRRRRASWSSGWSCATG